MATAEHKQEGNNDLYESLKALYYSGKVKPSLNKVLPALEEDPKNLPLNLLACEILERTKDFDALAKHADQVIKLAPEISDGYYFKGVALQFVKGKEQEAVKNFKQALEIDPNNLLCLKSKATTHLLLFKDFDLPIKFADKHRVKAEECLLKVLALVENKENPNYLELYLAAEVSMMVEQALNAKMWYLKAVNAYEEAAPEDQNKNIYKDIIKAQKKCIKQLEKFTE